jgi:hypothetical protein
MSSDFLREVARELFGFVVADVPETIPLRVWGLQPPVPVRAAIISAFRRPVIEVHPDLRLAYDHPQLQDAAEAALSEKPEIRELVWARDVLMEMAPNPVAVTGKSPTRMTPFYPSPPRKRQCKKCRRELKERECVLSHGPRRAWCLRCVAEDDRVRAAARRRRRRANKRCAGCPTIFTPTRSDGRYCSPRCRQVAYRKRVTAKRGDTYNPPLSVTQSKACV